MKSETMKRGTIKIQLRCSKRSNFWGNAFKDFALRLCSHVKMEIQRKGVPLRDVAYWVCTFSIDQWNIEEECGNGDWQASSFLLALRSGCCQGTAMIWTLTPNHSVARGASLSSS
mmetsp:Transcript_114712/g.222816  ORF Transcript_114712/g.222816 Transcript_114712/m.222816 type:complete len:115 (+) Transcript_114712:55-399(+)